MDQFLVAFDGRPLAYLQCWELETFPETGLGELQPGTRGINQFIGPVDMIGQGYGSAFIQLFTDGMLANDSPCAVRAYEKQVFDVSGWWRPSTELRC